MGLAVTPEEEETFFPLESSKYELHKLIGRGSTATVYAAKCLTNGYEVALKVIDLEQCPIEIDTLRAEVALWSSCHHPNLVKYYGSFIEKSKLYIITEYMDQGSIYEMIRFGFHRGIPKENIIAAVLKEILKALFYFHENRQMHRDVKAGNILVNNKGQIKLADFGIAARLIEKGQRVRARFTIIGTPCYMAPEVVCAGIGYSEKADIWSLGITAIELATGAAPYSNLHPLEVVVRISNSPPPVLPESFSSAFRDFVKCALNSDPEKRPTANELLNHWFIKQAASEKEMEDFFGSLPSIQEQYELIHKNAAKLLNKNNRDDNLNDNSNSNKNIANGVENDKNGIICSSSMEWDFSVEEAPRKNLNENKNEKEEENNGSEVVKKGKFTISKRSLNNLPTDDAIVNMMKTKISQMKERINQLKNQNRTLNNQIDSLFGELAHFVI
ncbi:STE20/SPS1-related proline-alanine-rich protein kinase [Tritrichomonas foetus]|uniref:non-specific serine/threonine protein kinase n=1 Tax=Tritrichomonas foetus TaxID=1144522 RepID=A0A1J4KLT6_9EUKA|nr:STE20/SPS1-related proline-alanine-rich protein kinase [Tritrichomonas foetus]|eukprot:OHT10654.1 STE20/SPS1-related proline-alanine-rich protein kinase [Tritrichomonas foetus]